MGIGKRLGWSSVVAASMLPGVAHAGGSPTVWVTLDPAAFLSPLLGVSAILLLAVVLVSIGAVAIYRQRSATRRILVVGLAVVFISAVRLVQAGVVMLTSIDGTECTQHTVKQIEAVTEVGLRNDCNNSVRIVDILLQFGDPCVVTDPVSPVCVIGSHLAPNQVCNLPWCDLS